VAFSSGPQHDPQQFATLHTDELEKRRMPATPATWALGIVIALAATAWIVMLILNLER
jgi:hypothetical protein